MEEVLHSFGVFSEWKAWVSLGTLSLLEIVLGLDNIVFLSILAGKLPREQQRKARRLGLMLALVTRLALLTALSWMMRMTEPLFQFVGRAFSGRDLILLGGGLFLVAKATFEIHDKMEHKHEPPKAGTGRFTWILIQIALLDVVFSLDSVITAVGMAQQLVIMVVAVILAVGVMLIFAGAIGDFVERHPSIKILALSFLLLIGVLLIADGMGKHIDKAYIYFAMAFSLIVELINMRVRKSDPAPDTLIEAGREADRAARESPPPAAPGPAQHPETSPDR
jgi:predicted tellurium resistance membrane protein TerC